MDAQTLAQSVMPNLTRVIQRYEFDQVARVVLKVGVLHAVGREDLSAALASLFAGTPLAGAQVTVQDLQPGEAFVGPDGKPARAKGLELVIVDVEGG